MKTEKEIKNSIDYDKVISYNQQYIDILKEERSWYEYDTKLIDLKVVKDRPSNKEKHELSIRRIQNCKKVHQLNGELESKMNYIAQVEHFLANEKVGKM